MVELYPGHVWFVDKNKLHVLELNNPEVFFNYFSNKFKCFLTEILIQKSC